MIALDTETTGLEWWKCKMFGLSYCRNEDDFGYDTIEKYESVFLEKILSSDEDIIFHNAKFDLHFLANAGYKIPKNIHDTMIMSHLLDENKSHKLADVSKRYVGAGVWKDGVKEYIKKNKCGYEDIPYEIMKEYSSKDALYTYKLFNFMIPLLKRQGLWELYLTEMKLLRVIFDMERLGVLIDVKVLKEAEPILTKKITDLMEEIIKLAGKEFNVMSEDELGEVLYKDLGLKIPGYCERSKKPRTDKYALEKLDHPITSLVIDYRLTRKLRDTYCLNILNAVDLKNILHCDFRQMGTRTGRFSCQKPNLQNIPSDQIIRRGFICRVGYYNFYFDYAQMELMVYAHFANEKSMKQAFANNDDLHKIMAQKFFDKQEITDTERAFIKGLNFGILYGMGARGISERFKKSLVEARKILYSYYNRFPIMQKFRKYMSNKIRMDGYITNPFGRKRRLKENEAYKAVNVLVQGTCADILKRALINVHDLLSNTKSNLLLSIHDEIKIEIHKDELDLVPKIKKVLEDFSQFSVPLKVDIKYTKTNWKEKKIWN